MGINAITERSKQVLRIYSGIDQCCITNKQTDFTLHVAHCTRTNTPTPSNATWKKWNVDNVKLHLLSAHQRVLFLHTAQTSTHNVNCIREHNRQQQQQQRQHHCQICKLFSVPLQFCYCYWDVNCTMVCTSYITLHSEYKAQHRTQNTERRTQNNRT